jgi:thiamine-monophosphate kinase
MGETLADLGEWELIRRLGAFAPPGQFTDDAALLPAGDSARLVVNTDVLVEGVHFSEATTAPADVGWRTAAANLSDLAAMGCTEVVGLSVGLVAPASTPWSWVEGVYGGLQEALNTFGGVILGGDCSGGDQRILAITAIGRLAACADPAADKGVAATGPGSPAQAVIRRGDGRPGDWLICTGPHGLSRLGLALLQNTMAKATAAGTAGGPGAAAAKVWPTEATTEDPASGFSTSTAAATDPASAPPCHEVPIDPNLRERAITTHRRPVPRFDAVRALSRCRPAGQAWRVGGCDSSDGLAAAVRAIAGPSGCAARLERMALPLDPAMAALDEAEAWCLGGGEDFELVLALDSVWAEALIAALPDTTRIGELVEGPAGNLGWSDGRPWPEPSSGIGGFQHFG